MTLPILVVGGGLAGMAAAARLAKQQYQVQLLERRDQLGGAWAPHQVDGATVDDAPSVIGFPAPWRDLFRKSGRPLEAELARNGRALLPAPPPRYVFADRSSLVLPTDRGTEYAVLAKRYGVAVARRWRDLLDPLERTWQDLRGLGLETELTDRRLAIRAGRRLWPTGHLAGFAALAPHPHLTALLRSVAHRLGSRPEETPAWCAVELALWRTFGRWMVTNGQTSALVEALADRLRLRRVAVELQTPVSRILVTGGRASGVVLASGRQIAASAVIWATDPWAALAALPRFALPRVRRDVRRLRPALAPLIRRRPCAEASPVEEVVELDADGVPVVRYLRPGLESVHDFRRATADPAWGPRWGRRSDLARRPPVTTSVSGLFLVGASSPAGNAPSQVVLSGALASTACANYAERSNFPG
jgi:phytoene dehydrogenase-like protein